MKKQKQQEKQQEKQQQKQKQSKQKQQKQQLAPLKQLTDVFRGARQRESLEVALGEYRAIQKEETGLKIQKQRLQEFISKIFKTKGVPGVACGTLTARLSTWRRETIVKGLLLGAGIDPKVIRKCTTVSVSEGLTVRDSEEQ
jgi:hypothetical protein